MAQLGVIHEIGDMGLGFSPISEQEEEQIKEKEQKDEQTKEKK